MTLIAIEEHWMLPELAAALAELPDGRRDDSLSFNDMHDNRQRLEDFGARRLEFMDGLGIDTALIALTPPGTQPLDPVDAVRLSQQANDRAAAAVRDNPDRLRALATLPMSSPTDVVAELERAASLGHVGTMVYGRSGERTLDDPVYEDFFASAERLRQPIFLHPQLPSPATRDASYRGFDANTDLALATFGWGWHLDAGLAALRLILRGTFDRHPDLQIVLGHWGEMLLFWLDRANSLARIAGLERTIADYVRDNVYITTSGMMNPALLHHALSVTTPDRLIFSTDYPFGRPSRDELETLLQHFETDADREKFCSGNAVSLFGL